MPGGDKMGPGGMGPMTGRAAGFCTGNAVPGYMNSVGGRWGSGAGRGRGFRRGFGSGFGYGGNALPPRFNAPVYNMPPVPTKEQELEMLKSQSEMFSRQVDEINRQIDEIRKADD